ncbi:hypothetical protein [Mesorhizobium sp.]|uniref:hypothetical protein n=1 Tax=Mesorhizobium sp. TaxID=1871066 RepID=UPI000B33763C|nr:hypothetical protein [Mesorhizobium sp.]TIO23577.1 MAG: hypothetical protein E5X83_21145 [Mesorhizobium sp.]
MYAPDIPVTISPGDAARTLGLALLTISQPWPFDYENTLGATRVQGDAGFRRNITRILAFTGNMAATWP